MTTIKANEMGTEYVVYDKGWHMCGYIYILTTIKNLIVVRTFDTTNVRRMEMLGTQNVHGNW